MTNNTRFDIYRFFFIVLLFFIIGCLPTVAEQPFYTEKDLIEDEALLGSWQGDETDLVIKQAEGGGLELALSDSQGTDMVRFSVKVFQLGPYRFLDLIHLDSQPKELAEMFFLGHQLMFYEFFEGKLILSPWNDGKVKKFLKSGQNEVAFKEITDKDFDRFVLTGTTEELQKFLQNQMLNDIDTWFTEDNILEKVQETPAP